MQQHITDYSARLASALTLPAIKEVPQLAAAFKSAWDNKKTIYLCGNGGSAGNAIHLANDFLYGAGLTRGIGLRIESLSANAAVLTCLANDIGYEEVYAEQLRVKANSGDVLVVFSGSGNFSIGISLFVVAIAALNLVLDFDIIEQSAEQGAPKHMEYFGSMALMATLIWLYIEILRLLAKMRSR